MLAYLGAALGVAVWAALWLWHRRANLTWRRLAGMLVAIGLLIRLCFVFWTPTFYAPDEQSHFKYIQYLAEHRTFPVQSSQTGAPSNDWEYYQPPLYYALLTPVYAVANALLGTVRATVYVLRLCSILLWLLTMRLAVKTLDALAVQDGFVRTLAISMIALLPTYTFISSMINNDNLLIAVGCALLYALVRRKPSEWPVWGMGGLLGMALLAKLTAVIYVGLLGLLAFLHLIQTADERARTGIRTAGVLLIAFVLWSPWGLRNWLVYGSITAEEVANIPHPWPSTAHALTATFQYMQRSFWAVSGIYNNVFGFYPRIGRGVSWVAAAGLLWGLGWRRALLRQMIRGRITTALALGLAILVNVALVIRFGLLYAQGQGRFLFPLLLPLALLMAAGLRTLPFTDRPAMRVHVASFWSVYALAFAGFSLTTFAGL